MALADADDVEAHLGRPLSDAEEAQVDSLLEESSDLVIGYCHSAFDGDEDPPSAVARVVAGITARSLIAAASDPFVQQQSAGPFSIGRSAAAASGDVWLTAADKVKLRPYRVGGGMTSVQLVGERYDIADDS